MADFFLNYQHLSFLLKSLGVIFLLIMVLIGVIWLLKGRPKQMSIRSTLLQMGAGAGD